MPINFKQSKDLISKCPSHLVVGFLKLDFANGFLDRTETHYAINEYGLVFKTVIQGHTNAFFPEGCKIESCDSIPESAEFIGYYKMPKASK